MAYYKTLNGITFLMFDLLSKYSDNLIHFSTTRLGTENNDFCMSFYHAEMNPGNPKFRLMLAKAFNISPSQFVFCRQTHSDNVHIVSDILDDNGFYKKLNAIQDTDAVVTGNKGICPVALTADCVPILLYDYENNVISAVHSGWRGSFKMILKKTIEIMINNYNCNSENIICCIGPSAGPCCYEVNDDVLQVFSKSFKNYKDFFTKTQYGKYKLDLWKVNHSIAVSCGLKNKNIEVAEICTMCNNETFHSARVHAGKAGRMATGIMIK